VNERDKEKKRERGGRRRCQSGRGVMNGGHAMRGEMGTRKKKRKEQKEVIGKMEVEEEVEEEEEVVVVGVVEVEVEVKVAPVEDDAIADLDALDTFTNLLYHSRSYHNIPSLEMRKRGKDTATI